MSDEFDRLRQRLDRVEPPDHWSEIVERAEEPEPAAPVEITRHRHRPQTLAWVTAVAAVLVGVVVWFTTATRPSSPAVGPPTTIDATHPTTLPTSAPSTAPASTTTTPSSTSTSLTAPTVIPTAASGSWTHPCADQNGAARPADIDDFSDDRFGPLAPEPGLRIVLPIENLPSGYSQPIPSTARVPGGFLVTLNAGPTPHGGSQFVAAVVDDDGSVRWRRCIDDFSASQTILDASGQRLLMHTDANTPESAWWAFDLMTGESGELADDDLSTTDVTVPTESPPEVNFHGGDYRRAQLRRVDGSGVEVWRRDDLFDLGGEGFRTSTNITTAAGNVTLVRACVGAPISDDGQCDVALLGVDTDDGHTLWQLDGAYRVSEISDGLAIVTADQEELARYELLDIATGQFVPDAISQAPGAFIEECCGGYDTNRVESTGSLAWTISNQVINVWFPADRPGPGLTIDLFGASARPQVTAYRWMPIDSICGEGFCVIVRASASGFTPGELATARCYVGTDGNLAQRGDPVEVTAGPDGSIWVDGLCSISQKEPAVVVIGDTSSPAI